MDHLFLPKDPLPTTLDKVPYMCVEKYDGGPFLTYPLRKGKPWMVPDKADPLYIPYVIYEVMRPTPKAEQESFMQTWLFFGFLNEVLGDLYSEEDFVVKDDAAESDRFVVCTGKLRPLLEAACKLRFEEEPHAIQKQFENLRECLLLLITVSSAFRSDFDWGLMCSIAAVHEATVYSIHHITKKVGSGEIPTMPWAGKYFRVAIRNRMLEAGWCSSEIERAKDKFSNTQSFYFMSRMRKNEIRRNHLACTTSLCSALQVDLATYQTKHRRASCNCLDAILNIDDVVTLLRSQKLPLLKITQKDEHLESLKVEVVAYTPETRYVAISHVWADGLGNPRGNSVPACQLSYILERINTLRGSTTLAADPVTRAQDAEGGPLLIWLDTLCCPVLPRDAHSLALAQMRRTYQDARHVLVLDSDLQIYASDEITVFEALFRVFLSGWMSRLWTLQEGSLARTIWIQFKDRPVELDVLMARMLQLGDTDWGFLPFNLDMIRQFRSLRPTFPYQISNTESSAKPIGMLLYDLDMALQHRATTVAADEPLCIGNLLDLPAEEILKVPPTSAARMGRVWELIATKYGGIPQYIIGFELPRLIERGKRWAPRTLLVMKEGNFDVSGSRAVHWMEPGLGIPSADGLLVKFPGFRIHPRQPEDEKIRIPWKPPPDPSSEPPLFAIDVDGTRYQLHSPADSFKNADESEAGGLARNLFLHDLVRSRSCAFILFENPMDETNWRGLLVQIVKNTNEILHVEYISHTIVSTLGPTQNIVYGTAERLARSLRQEAVVANVARLMPESKSDEESDEYKSAVENLKLRIQAVTAEFLSLNNAEFSKAWKSVAGDDRPESYFWNLVARSIYDDYTLTKLPEEQMWCVD